MKKKPVPAPPKPKLGALRQKIGGMLFQRTALAKKPRAVISVEIGKLRDGPMSPSDAKFDGIIGLVRELDVLQQRAAYWIKLSSPSRKRPRGCWVIY